MVLKLLYPLVRYASFFNIFQYVTFRAAYAAITALLIAFLFGPWVIRHLRGLKAGHQVREDVPESHRAKTGTPSMGGTLIVLSITASVLIWQDPSTIYTWMLLAAVLGYGGIGFVDDLLKLYRRKGLAAWVKFGGQIAVSCAIVALLYVHRNEHTTLLYLPFLKRAVIDLGWFYAPFAVLLLTWYSNSVNITDGLDGLATGLVILVGLSVSVLAYLTGRRRLGRLPRHPVHQGQLGDHDLLPRHGGGIGRFPLVQRPPGGSHDGRHGEPCAGRRPRRGVAHHQEGGAAARPRRRVRASRGCP